MGDLVSSQLCKSALIVLCMPLETKTGTEEAGDGHTILSLDHLGLVSSSM
jgi:hypothetical protein